MLDRGGSDLIRSSYDATLESSQIPPRRSSMTVAAVLAAAGYFAIVWLVARTLSDKWHPDGGKDTPLLMAPAPDGSRVLVVEEADSE